MIEVSVSYKKYGFLGCEFLTYIWYLIENNLYNTVFKDNPVILNIGNRIVLENSLNNSVESITIKGDDAGLEEGIIALKKGAVVKELNLVYRDGDNDWKFTIKGESLNFTNFKTPETGPVEKKEDMEGAVLEKIYLYEKGINLVSEIYYFFINQRISDNWASKIVPDIKKWISSYKTE